MMGEDSERRTGRKEGMIRGERKGGRRDEVRGNDGGGMEKGEGEEGGWARGEGRRGRGEAREKGGAVFKKSWTDGECKN